ncbi:MAG TPA: glycogen debranching N-terminal domain-containing protein [bacterium]|nr:glycogen debranching N-terminal domain-containing protein [bacterium]
MAEAILSEIKVGPQVITVNHGRAFMVSGLDGAIRGSAEQGLFMQDTRVLSHYRMRINGRAWKLVTSAPVGHAAARFEFTNPMLTGPAQSVPRHVLGLSLSRTIDESVREEFDIVNYYHAPLDLVFTIEIGSDFADLFEVRRNYPRIPRHVSTAWDARDQELTAQYVRDAYSTKFRYQLAGTATLALREGHKLLLHFTLNPHEHRRLRARMIPEVPPIHHAFAWLDRMQHAREPRSRKPQSSLAQFLTSDRALTRTLAQSADDLISLVLDRWDGTPGVLSAGVPWFVALFGRDALIAGLQTLPLHPGFALGALDALAAYQAASSDDFRDSDPGKILHELRVGELARFGEIPHTPYYGSADATILYPILLHETYCWTGNHDLLTRYMPVAQRCVDWVDRYGDLDGDGFQEYHTRSRRGIQHQGWKDSGDGTVHADGRRVEPPVALCELQGYVYDAKRRMAALYDELGRGSQADRLREAAEMLRTRFNDAFWLEGEGTYAFGLDSQKARITSIVSNAGHCLWSGIVPVGRARRVIARLFEDDMWSGWGVRTLSATHVAFNPFAYQRGAVWPHDNLLIAVGCRRYGDVDAAARIARGIFDAAAGFQGHRIPELIGGQARRDLGFPAQYLGANIPQAWAAGSTIALIGVLLGLRPDARHHRLYVSPKLPAWLDWVEVRALRVGDARINLRCGRENGRSLIESCETTGPVEVIPIDSRGVCPI